MESGGVPAGPARAPRWSIRREALVVRIALGVIAVHVADDSFVQPQPGTGAGDHLASGLVPIGALVLAGVVYPRLRAGARAILASTIGLVATVGGVAEAGYYTLKVGPSGDDFTGLLMLAAGVVLLATGVVTLWTTRRLDVALHGWYVPSRNGAAVIAFPGRSGPQRHARMLVRHGYGVLLFDRRGEGDSEGDPGALGWGMDRDLKAALAYLGQRPDVEDGRIGGLGLSVGGELLLETSRRAGRSYQWLIEARWGITGRAELEKGVP